jgi:hypothetical protein
MANVPNVPGVPSLSSYSPNNITLLLEDVVSEIIGALLPQWGIFLDGIPVLTYDNQLNFGYSQEWRISTYPVEQGSFMNYDKVQVPSEIRCRFSAGASAINRQAMLQSIDAVMNTTDLYDVVTPEKVFISYNFIRREYDREAANVGLVVIDLILMEVIQTATAQFSNTQNPTMGSQYGVGTVPVGTPSSSTTSSISGQAIG